MNRFFQRNPDGVGKGERTPGGISGIVSANSERMRCQRYRAGRKAGNGSRLWFSVCKIGALV